MTAEKNTEKRSMSVILGAAFLMATSAIGPGFLTQTSQFTAKFMASFAFVIVCVIIMDIVAQTNIWSVIGVSGKRGQEIANAVLPGLGKNIVFLIIKHSGASVKTSCAEITFMIQWFCCLEKRVMKGGV